MASTIEPSTNQSLPIKSLSADLEAAVKAAKIYATVVSSKPINVGQTNSNTAVKGHSAPESNYPLNPTKQHSPTLTKRNEPASTLSPPSDTKKNTNSTFQIVLATAKGNITVSTQTPLDPGTPIRLTMTEKGLTLVIIPPNDKAIAGKVATGHSATGLEQQNVATASRLSTRTASTVPTSPLSRQDTVHGGPISTGRPVLSTQQIIDNGIRQALPQQQSLRLVIPLLNQISQLSQLQQPLSQPLQQPPHQPLQQSIQQPNTASANKPQSFQGNTANQLLSRELTQTIKQLIQQLPTSDQLQSAPHLKMAIKNSGIFLETKLAHPSNLLKTNSNHRPINNDIKAISQKLLAMIDKASLTASSSTSKITIGIPTGNAPSPSSSATKVTPDVPIAESKLAQENLNRSVTTPNSKENTSSRPLSAQPPSTLFTANLPPSGAASTLTTGQIPTDDEIELLIIQPQKDLALPHHIPIRTAAREAKQNVDIALRQLGKQLLASLARTQLNQLESLTARKVNNRENQGASNSWTLEIPIINGSHIDNLKLRIDQDEQPSSEDNKEEKSEKKMWTVMMDFDLHALGKMNIQLKVIDNSVSATIWSQLEHTHREVQQQIDLLHKGLEMVGAKVKQVECKLGSPPKGATLLQRQLVDIRT